MSPEMELLLKQMSSRIEKIEAKVDDLTAFKVKIMAIAGFVILIAKLAGPIIDKLL